MSLLLGSLHVEGVWSRDGTTVDQERQAYLLFSVAAAISLSRFAHVYCALSMKRKETLNTEESKVFVKTRKLSLCTSEHLCPRKCIIICGF